MVRRGTPVNAGSAPVPVGVEAEENASALARVFNAGVRYDGAPTLRELTEELQVDPALRTTPEKLSIALHELTGLPRHHPLDFIRVDYEEDVFGWTPPAALVLLARALDRLEGAEIVGAPASYAVGGEAWLTRRGRCVNGCKMRTPLPPPPHAALRC